MKLNSCILLIIGISIIIFHNILCIQELVKNKITISVSTEQEQNYYMLIQWLNTHSSLKNNNDLKNAYQILFEAGNKNDIDLYFKEIGNLSSIQNKLSKTEEKRFV